MQRFFQGWQMESRTCSLPRASYWQLCGALHTNLSVGAKCYPSRMGAVCTPLFILLVLDSMSRQNEMEVLNLSRSPLLELYPVWWFCIQQILMISVIHTKLVHLSFLAAHGTAIPDFLMRAHSAFELTILIQTGCSI